MCERVAVAVCLRCGAHGVPLSCLASGGALESVCKGCFYLAEIDRLLRVIKSSDSKEAARVSLEELYTFLRSQHLEEVRDGP